MDETPQPELPANLQFLRILVTVLTAVMICGVVVVVGLLVTRLNREPAALPLPDVIKLPDGASASALTRGNNWYAVVTDDDRILIYSLETGQLTQEIQVQAP